MNLREALREGRRLLAGASSDEAELEAELLLGHALRLDHVHLYQRLEDGLAPPQMGRFRALLRRRLSHEPTAYILGRREFYGLDFAVTAAAIIPRPETEVLVDLVLAFARHCFGDRPFALADIGAGCGAIAVALAQGLPNAAVIATDISPAALALARRNARRHGLTHRIRFLLGDLLEPLDGPAEVIAANLPYVPTPEWERLPPESRAHEPRYGLDGGRDGLRLIGRLLQQGPRYLNPGGALFAEIGDQQGEAARALARQVFPNAAVTVEPDLAGLDRVLVVET